VPTRRATYNANLEAATRLAASLPLVHRTGYPSQPLPWQDILRTGELRMSDVTDVEQQCGWSRAVYFFLGCAAYPKGNVGLLFDCSLSATTSGSFSPFDSGALSSGFVVPIENVAWTISDQAGCLDRNSADVANLEAFAGPYVAAHFNQPASYVSRPQKSTTDFDVYHRLRSTTEDRRAWTIEVRLHDNVRLDLPGGYASSHRSSESGAGS